MYIFFVCRPVYVYIYNYNVYLHVCVQLLSCWILMSRLNRARSPQDETHIQNSFTPVHNASCYILGFPNSLLQGLKTSELGLAAALIFFRESDSVQIFFRESNSLQIFFRESDSVQIFFQESNSVQIFFRKSDSVQILSGSQILCRL